MSAAPALLLSCSSPGPEFWERLRRHAETGIPVVLSGLDSLTPAEAQRLVHFFLHEPAVTSPIQPLADLLAAMLHRREMSLWDVQAAGAPARTDFLRTLPQEQPACLECACFPSCLGYGAWAGSCATWRALLTGLAAAARALARLRARQASPASVAQDAPALPAQG